MSSSLFPCRQEDTTPYSALNPEISFLWSEIVAVAQDSRRSSFQRKREKLPLLRSYFSFPRRWSQSQEEVERQGKASVLSVK